MTDDASAHSEDCFGATGTTACHVLAPATVLEFAPVLDPLGPKATPPKPKEAREAGQEARAGEGVAAEIDDSAE